MVRGMLILGCVQEIKDFELMISLPHGVSGIVKITDISDAYTKLLERITSGEEITETQVLTVTICVLLASFRIFLFLLPFVRFSCEVL